VGSGDAVSVSLPMAVAAAVGAVAVVAGAVVAVGVEGAVVVVMRAIAAGGRNANRASKLTVNRLSSTARLLAIRRGRFMGVPSFVPLSLLRYL
jgi:hypothetical protein